VEREILFIEVIDLILTIFVLATLWDLKDKLKRNEKHKD